MKRQFLYSALTILLVLPGAPLLAAPRERTTLDEANEVLDSLAMTPEKCVPPALLHEASAVIIAPDVVKGGLVIAARYGHGVMLVRDKQSGWSNPVLVTMSGGGVGLQVGVQKTDVFLVIRSHHNLKRIMNNSGKLTLGVDASVAAGPLGRQVAANNYAEVLSYSHTRGIFVGAAFDGDTVRIDQAANERVYNIRGVSVADIVANKTGVPEAANALRAKLGLMSGNKFEVAPKLPTQSDLPPLPRQ
jgi:lipid-binding SYLF domain-containing protein